MWNVKRGKKYDREEKESGLQVSDKGGGADSLGENMENNREIIERKRKDIKRKEQREDSEGTCTMKGQGH